ncbi:hypothetical protein ACFQ9X_06965 [Catenulispora yoronensis]
MTFLVTAACSSSGTVGESGSGAELDLGTVSAADAVRAASAAQIAKHTVRVRSFYSNKLVDQTVDAVESTERAAVVSTNTAQQKGGSSPSPQHGELRLDYPVLYIDDPGLPARFLHGKQWAKLDLDHLPPGDSSDDGLAFYARLGASFRNDDPKQNLLFPLLYPDLRRVGVESRNGQQVLHIEGSVTPQTLPATPPPGSGMTQAYLDGRRKAMTDTQVTKDTFDLWIGRNGLVTEVKETHASSGPTGDVTNDVLQSDWGTPLVVTAPPADQTYVVPAS